ncbi:MAG: primosomal protein N' [Arcobacteraceae bacterium]|nr:primosomal protein N' [Arcobacteraceae bacterium]
MSEQYYEIALLKSPLSPLTFKSTELIKIGSLVMISLKNRKKEDIGVVVKEVEKPTFKCSDISTVLETFHTKFTLEVAFFIAKYYVCSIGEALGLFIPFTKNSLIAIEKNNFDTNIILSPKQQEAFNFCKQHKRTLLFANTGSGKTEIYLKSIEKVLNEGKNCVYLLPEIALTPQMEKRLKKVFKDAVAIWHSKISQKKKNEILIKLATGEVKIIAGARSALFLPYPNLGLIVVDEEHDDSYKSEQKPRVHVKDLAIYLSQKYDIQLILGSATPSLNSFAKVPYFRLKETFHQTDKTFIYNDSTLKLNDLLINKIKEKLDKKEQTIIFLPTRANFKYQICSDCGKAIECPFCSVALSLHKNHKALKCHYCNYTQQIIEKCPSCHTGILKNYRLGTNELQEQLKNIFPNNEITTFDRDSVKTETNLKKILKDFNENKIDILIGTQMLSKGHDYHNVTLAIILGIDSVLNMTSYKAREKALSLALQIAGRSGRNGKGEVILQTKNQEFFETYMEKVDYKDFLENELQERGEFYPPNTRVAKVIFSHTNHQKAKELMEFYTRQIINYHKGIELVGYKECEIFKISNKYRYEILLRGKDIKKILEFLHSIDSPYATIDMDTLA